MKTESHYEIVDTQSAKQKELIFWAKLAIKEMEKLNRLWDDVIKRCEEAERKENETKL